MREHVYDGMGGPFDDVPYAPDNCVVCGTPLSDDNEAGEVPDYGDGGLTCSAPCHDAWAVKRRADHAQQCAEEQAASEAWSAHCTEEAAR